VRGIPVLCVLVLALASSSSAAQTRVAFLAAGDYGVGGSRELSLGLRMKGYESPNPANMLVTLGDNDYTESPARFRENWRRSFGWARRTGLRVAGVLGNHDYGVGRGRYQFRLLGMPGPYYTRRLGDAQLFLLDSNAITDRQTAWLEQQLAESTSTWKIAVFHHPPFTCGGHSGSSTVQRRWVPLFESYGVQLVLSGHDHNYQRFATQNGVTYVVHGGGGAGLYRPRGCPSSYPRRVRARYEHGFLSVSIGPDDLQVAAVDLRGRRTDHLTLTP
jgi:3',5'-cyclic AMP phosphodiesterase CpdA